MFPKMMIAFELVNLYLMDVLFYLLSMWLLFCGSKMKDYFSSAVSVLILNIHLSMLLFCLIFGCQPRTRSVHLKASVLSSWLSIFLA
jgi:hypothetical protein